MVRKAEMIMDRLFFALGSLSALLAVALGAFGAHGLKGRLSSELLDAFEVGVRYHIFHALALLAVAWAWSRWPRTEIVLAGWLFLTGTLLFSGSLYLLAITGARWMGIITPFGGLAFILGWLALAWGAWQG
jgi:uncharacterized membrane protein YgdD (TMEM256/DUF423 family)